MKLSSSLPIFKLIAGWLATCILCATALAGCETTTKTKEFFFKPQVSVTLTGSPSQNPDEKGLPLSVVVRLYTLRSKDKFERAALRTLQRSDKEALGDDIVFRSPDIILRPGEVKKDIIISLKEPEKPKATHAEYVAVIAFLRKPEGESWRQIIPLNNSKPDVEVLVQERGMKITLD